MDMNTRLSDPRHADDFVLEWSDEPGDWDGFVEKHPWRTVYHLTAWRRILQDAFSHIKGRFLLLRSSGNGRILGGVPLYTIRSWLLGNRLVGIPFASFSDPLVTDGVQLGSLVEESRRYAQLQGIPSIEIRLNEASGLAEQAGLEPALYSRHHFVSLEEPEEKIWASLSKTSVRQCVRRAENSGVRIASGLEEPALGVFLRILSITRRRRSLPNIPGRFFEAMKRHLSPDRLNCWIAYDRSGNPLSGLLGWRLGDKFAVEYSGDFSIARGTGATQYLYWHVMRQAQSLGCKIFSFGRTGLNNAGLLSYKRHWGTVEEDLKLIAFPRAASRSAGRDPFAFRTAKTMIAHSPSPLYRLIGEFCYRHLG